MKNLLLIASVFCYLSCTNSTSQENHTPAAGTETVNTRDSGGSGDTNAAQQVAGSSVAAGMNDAAAIMGKKQVPILCYHHIKDITELPKNTAGYTVTAARFRDQLKALADSG